MSPSPEIEPGRRPAAHRSRLAAWRRGRWGAGAVALLLLGAWLPAACRPAETPAPEPIRFGLLGPFGDGAVDHSLGNPAVRAARLTVELLNDAGGIEVAGERRPIELLVRNNTDRPEVAVRLARELINQEQVVALIGPLLSRNALAVAPLADSQQIPMLTPTATHSRLAENRQYVFRMSPSDDVQALLLARFLFAELEIRTAAILYDAASDYNQNFATLFDQRFRELGGEIVASETYTTGETDFAPQLERIHRVAPGALLLPNYSDDVPVQVEQATAQGISAILVGADTWDRRAFPDRPEFEGSYFIDFWHESLVDESTRPFLEAYQGEFEDRISSSVVLTHDAVHILARAITVAGSTEGPAIRQALLEMGPFKGMAGTFTFDRGVEPIEALPLLSIRDGRLEIRSWLPIEPLP